MNPERHDTFLGAIGIGLALTVGEIKTVGLALCGIAMLLALFLFPPRPPENVALYQ